METDELLREIERLRTALELMEQKYRREASEFSEWRWRLFSKAHGIDTESEVIRAACYMAEKALETIDKAKGITRP